jgi:predicted RND superfamily exporter protein
MLISLTRWSLAHPLLVTTITAVITVGFALGIPRVKREITVRTFLGADHEAVQRLDDHIATFGGAYPVIIAYSCNESPNCSSIFDESALTMAAELADALARVYGVRAVHSPATTPLLLAQDGDLVVQRLTSEEPAEIPDRKALVATALADPRWHRTLIGQEGIVGAIVVDVASSESRVQESIAKALTEILAPYEQRGWTFHLVGELIDFAFSGRELERASQAMVPAMTALLACVLFILLRSAALAVVTVGAMGLAYVWTQGAMGWTGIKLNPVTSVTPSLVFAVGILDGVHLVTQYTSSCWKQGARSPRERQQIMVSAVEDVGRACLFTSLTTIAAFLSFAASGIASFAQFGTAASWGVLSALLITFGMLPIVLVRLPVRALGTPGTHGAWDALVGTVLEIVSQRRRLVIGLAGLLCLVSLVGLSMLRVEIRPELLMGEENRVTLWSKWLRRNLRETESLEISFTLPGGLSHNRPEVLHTLDNISDWLSSNVDGIGPATSVVDLIQYANKSIRSGDERFGVVESSEAGNAQLTLLLSLSDAETLDRWVAREYGASATEITEKLRVFAEARSLTTREQERVINSVEHYLNVNIPGDWEYQLTGSIPVYLEMMNALQRYQLICFGLAGATSLVLMAVLLGSIRASLLGLIPSILPCVTTLGMLGWWGWGLDPASTMVATIIVGVAVDDSIHLLSSYLVYRRLGASPGEAIDSALRHVGRAVIISSIVLAAAFWSLTMSPSSSVAAFGFLSGVSIVSALFADLLILPSLILILSRGASQSGPQSRERIY